MKERGEKVSVKYFQINRLIKDIEKKDFLIDYSFFNDTKISNLINLKDSDKIIKVDLDFKTPIIK